MVFRWVRVSPPSIIEEGKGESGGRCERRRRRKRSSLYVAGEENEEEEEEVVRG